MSMEKSNEDLIKEIKTGQNVKSNMYQLYKQNLTLIKRWSDKYVSAFGSDDILQECYIALHNAVQSFDVEKEYKFTTYLEKAIKTHLSRATARNDGAKLGASDKKLLMEYNTLNEQTQQATGSPISDHSACCKLNCTKEQIDRIRHYMDIIHPASIDMPIESENDTNLSNIIPSGINIVIEYEEKELRARSFELWDLVHDALDEKAERVIVYRFKDNKTLKETGEHLNLTAERIRTLESNALKVLRKNRPIKQYAKENYGYEYAYKNGGFNSWRYNQASSVELAAEKAEQHRQRMYDKIRAEAQKDIDEWYKALLTQIQSD